MTRLARLPAWAVILLGAGLALAVRLRPDPVSGLWLDEGVSVLVAVSGNLGSALLAAAVHDAHPPLYDLVLWGWVHLAHSIEWLRLLSVGAGVVAVAGAVAVARRGWGNLAALATGLLGSLCPWHVYFSREIRMYALESALAPLSLLTLLRALEHGRRRDWVLHGISAVLFAWTDFWAPSAVLAQALWLISRRRHLAAEVRRSALVTYGLILLGMLPLLSVAAGILLHRSGSAVYFNTTRVATLLSDLGIGFAAPFALSVTAVWLILLTLGMCLLMLGRDSAAGLVALSAGVPLLVMTVASLVTPAWLERSVVFVAPAFWVLVGAALALGADRLRSRSRPLVPALALGTGGLLLLSSLLGLAALWSLPAIRQPSEGAHQLARSWEQRGGEILAVNQYVGLPLYAQDRLGEGKESTVTEGASRLRPTLGPALDRLARLPGGTWLRGLLLRADAADRQGQGERRLAYSQVHDWVQARLSTRREFLVAYLAEPQALLLPKLDITERGQSGPRVLDDDARDVLALVREAGAIELRTERRDRTVFVHFGVGSQG